MAGILGGIEGAHCKLRPPKPGQSLADFENDLSNGVKIATRTYTVWHIRPEALELDIDFVDHGDTRPASTWARAAKPGDFLAFMGPGPLKVAEFEAVSWIIAADISALPIASATLEKLPADATGVAIFEVPSFEDKQDLNAPEGIEQIWLLQKDTHQTSLAQVEEVIERPWPASRIKTCIAGETGTIRAFKQLIERDKALPRSDVYISGYWKIGLLEDEHQAVKRRGG